MEKSIRREQKKIVSEQNKIVNKYAGLHLEEAQILKNIEDEKKKRIRQKKRLAFTQRAEAREKANRLVEEWDRQEQEKQLNKVKKGKNTEKVETEKPRDLTVGQKSALFGRLKGDHVPVLKPQEQQQLTSPNGVEYKAVPQMKNEKKDPITELTTRSESSDHSSRAS